LIKAEKDQTLLENVDFALDIVISACQFEKARLPHILFPDVVVMEESIM